MFPMIYTGLRPGHLSVRVGDGSRHSEEIVKILNCAFYCDCYFITTKLCTNEGDASVHVVARFTSISMRLPRWPRGKASASRAEGPGFESRLRRDFFGIESYQ